MSYTKLHAELLDSTIWLESPSTKIVWITMLAMRDDRHEVQASVPGLARRAGVTVEECKRALSKFLAPDPDSRSQEYEGRRIEEVRGGWRILNGDYYQKRQSEAERKSYKALWIKNKRLEEKLECLQMSTSTKVDNVDVEEKSRVEKSREEYKSLRSSTMKRPRRVSRKPDKRVTRIRDLWIEAYKSRYGVEPTWNGQHAKFAKSMISTLERNHVDFENRVPELISKYLDDSGEVYLENKHPFTSLAKAPERWLVDRASTDSEKKYEAWLKS